jgi:hypothetical protein
MNDRQNPRAGATRAMHGRKQRAGYRATDDAHFGDAA